MCMELQPMVPHARGVARFWVLQSLLSWVPLAVSMQDVFGQFVGCQMEQSRRDGKALARGPEQEMVDVCSVQSSIWAGVAVA